MQNRGGVRGTSFGHQPALDGLRGLALVGVLCYHGGLALTSGAGAFLTVSTFFTLSGFLITTILLSEFDKSGSIDLRRFYTRRARRLIPGATLGIAVAVGYGLLVADATQGRALRGDVIASVFNVANWRFLFGGQSYGDLFSAPSPLQHYWSLAIEEQFYLIFPLVLFALLKATKSVRTTGMIIATATVGLALVPFAVDMSTDRFYYGTDMRAPELLSGSVLAFMLRTRGPMKNWYARVGIAIGGWAALAATLTAWILIPEEAPWLYKGGFAAYSLLTGVVLLASIQPDGVVRLFLTVRPLQWLGRISYGIYVLHWPIFLWLNPQRVPLDTVPLFGVRMAVSLVAAVASYRLVEEPLRTGTLLPTMSRFARAMPALSGLLIVAAVAITLNVAEPPNDFDELSALSEESQQLSAARVAESAPATVPPRSSTTIAAEVLGETVEAANVDLLGEQGPPDLLATLDRPVRIMFVGDSNGMVTGIGTYRWALSSGRADVIVASQLGCGLARGGLRFYDVPDQVVPERCEDWPETWPEALETHQPDLIVVMTGPWEVANRLLEGDTVWRAAGDPVYDEYLIDELAYATEILSSTNVPVMIATSPYINLDGPFAPYPASESHRMDRVNEIFYEVAAQNDLVSVFDLAGLYDELLPGGQLDPLYRPDGIHLSLEASLIVGEWLGPELIDAWVRVSTQNPEPIS